MRTQETNQEAASTLGLLSQLSFFAGLVCLALIPITAFTDFDVLPIWAWPLVTLGLWILSSGLRVGSANARQVANAEHD
jgi:hypothetical protein